MKYFKKGDKVRCIDDLFKNSCLLPFELSEIQKPVKGEEYIIREVIYSSGNKGILLEGIENEEKYNMFTKEKEEPSFKPKRFKKVYK